MMLVSTIDGSRTAGSKETNCVAINPHKATNDITRTNFVLVEKATIPKPQTTRIGRSASIINAMLCYDNDDDDDDDRSWFYITC